MNDNQTPTNDTLAWQIREFVRVHGVSVFFRVFSKNIKWNVEVK